MATNPPNVQTNVPYNPLPRSSRVAEHIEMTENIPPSPAFATQDLDRSQSNTPQPPNIDDIPPGAAAPIPRFYGAAANESRPRYSYYSYSSSFDASAANSAGGYDQSSLHALDPGNDISAYPGRLQSPLMSEMPYRDNPSEPVFYPPGTGSPRVLREKQTFYTAPNKRKRKGLVIGGAIAGIGVAAVVAVILVYLFVIRKHEGGSSSSSNPSTSSAPGSQPTNNPVSNIVTWGGDGTTVTMEDGTNFTYSNKFGGYWVQDPSNPFNNSARAQSWTPALNETFNYGVDKIRGSVTVFHG
jgi:glucan 1,3-beta-glucosidase